MKLNMSKFAGRIILGLFIFSVVASSCGNKGKKDKDATKDSIAKKPTDPGT